MHFSEGKVMAASGRDRSRAQAPNGTNGGAPRAQRERGVGSKLCCRQRPEQMHNSEQPESFVQQDYFYTPWTIEQMKKHLLLVYAFNAIFLAASPTFAANPFGTPAPAPAAINIYDWYNLGENVGAATNFYFNVTV